MFKITSEGSAINEALFLFWLYLEDAFGLGEWAEEMKNALLVREDANVILVDWSGGSRQLYGQAAGNTRLVGAQIGELIKFIIDNNGGSKDLADRFYVIGFSLGGQIAGYAGRHLRGSEMVLGRITGKNEKVFCFARSLLNWRER